MLQDYCITDSSAKVLQLSATDPQLWKLLERMAKGPLKHEVPHIAQGPSSSKYETGHKHIGDPQGPVTS